MAPGMEFFFFSKAFEKNAGSRNAAALPSMDFYDNRIHECLQ